MTKSEAGVKKLVGQHTLKKSWQYYSIDEVRRHCYLEDCWVTYKGYVFDVTKFLDQHPGGANLILSYAGNDVKSILSDSSSHEHTASAYGLLNEYKIGKLLLNESDVNCETQHDIEEEFIMDGWNEELLDWDQGLVKQVHKLGPDYLKWVHSPVNRKLKLFDSEFVEFFSKTPWYMIPIVWIPYIFYTSFVALTEMHSTSGKNESIFDVSMFCYFLFLFFIGLPFWTFIEYVLHRYLFHLEPKGNSPYSITLHFFLHGQHHKVPFDGSRLVFPPVAASFFVYIFQTMFTSMFTGGIGRAMFAGGLTGYVIYDLMHYYLHHGTPDRGSYLHSLKYYHVLHHFDDDSTGVLKSWWKLKWAVEEMINAHKRKHNDY